MTLEERVAKALDEMMDWTVGFDRSSREQALRAMKASMTAAFPELFTDPPTHKLAPLEPTEEMCIAFDAGHEDAYETTEYPTRAGLRSAIKASP